MARFRSRGCFCLIALLQTTVPFTGADDLSDLATKGTPPADVAAGWQLPASGSQPSPSSTSTRPSTPKPSSSTTGAGELSPTNSTTSSTDGSQKSLLGSSTSSAAHVTGTVPFGTASLQPSTSQDVPNSTSAAGAMSTVLLGTTWSSHQTRVDLHYLGCWSLSHFIAESNISSNVNETEYVGISNAPEQINDSVALVLQSCAEAAAAKEAQFVALDPSLKCYHGWNDSFFTDGISKGGNISLAASCVDIYRLRQGYQYVGCWWFSRSDMINLTSQIYAIFDVPKVSLQDACALIARHKDYDTFVVQQNRTCFGGSGLSTFSVGFTGYVDSCPDSQQTAKAYVTDEGPMDELTQWSTWTSCSRGCGVGKTTRARYRIHADAPLLEMEDAVCNERSCPWTSDYPKWAGCWSTVQGQMLSLESLLLSAADANPGTRQAAEEKCAVLSYARYPAFAVQGGRCWAINVTDPGALYSNTAASDLCPSFLSRMNSGSDYDVYVFSKDPPPASWGAWSPFDSCTLACGVGGKRVRKRECNNPRATTSCPPGEPQEKDLQSCNNNACPASLGTLASEGCYTAPQGYTEPVDPLLDGLPRVPRKDQLKKCAVFALSMNYSLFGLIDNGYCWTGPMFQCHLNATGIEMVNCSQQAASHRMEVYTFEQAAPVASGATDSFYAECSATASFPPTADAGQTDASPDATATVFASFLSMSAAPLTKVEVAASAAITASVTSVRDVTSFSADVSPLIAEATASPSPIESSTITGLESSTTLWQKIWESTSSQSVSTDAAGATVRVTYVTGQEDSSTTMPLSSSPPSDIHPQTNNNNTNASMWFSATPPVTPALAGSTAPSGTSAMTKSMADNTSLAYAVASSATNELTAPTGSPNETGTTQSGSWNITPISSNVDDSSTVAQDGSQAATKFSTKENTSSRSLNNQSASTMATSSTTVASYKEIETAPAGSTVADQTSPSGSAFTYSASKTVVTATLTLSARTQGVASEASSTAAPISSSSASLSATSVQVSPANPVDASAAVDRTACVLTAADELPSLSPGSPSATAAGSAVKPTSCPTATHGQTMPTAAGSSPETPETSALDQFGLPPTADYRDAAAALTTMALNASNLRAQGEDGKMFADFLKNLITKLVLNNSVEAGDFFKSFGVAMSSFVGASMASAWMKAPRYGGMMLQSAEEIAMYCASLVGNATVIEPKLAMQIITVPSTHSGQAQFAFDSPFSSAPMSLTIPAAIFATAAVQQVTVVSIQLQDFASVMNSSKAANNGSLLNGTLLPGVLSVRTNVAASGSTLPVDVIVKMGYNNTGVSSKMNSTCVFWNVSSEQWSSGGCTTVTLNSSLECHCNHLTSFAVLMRVDDYEPEGDTATALTYISYVGCGISVACLITTFGVLLYLNNLKTDKKTIHMNLVVSLGIAQVTHISGINLASDSITCMVIAAMLHFFYSTAFFWMLCEGLHLYLKVVAVFNSENASKRIIYYLIGYVCPAVIVGVSLGVRHDGYGNSKFCWLSTSDGLVWAFIGPVCAIILCNIVILCIVMKIVISTAATIPNKKKKDFELVKTGVKGVMILMPLLGVSWLLGLLAVNNSMLVFEFLFVIINSTQGLFIFLFHCVGSSEVRSAFRRKRDQTSRSKDKRSSLAQSTNDQNPNNNRTAKEGIAILVEDPRFPVLYLNNFQADGQKVPLTIESAIDGLLNGTLGLNVGGLKHAVPEDVDVVDINSYSKSALDTTDPYDDDIDNEDIDEDVINAELADARDDDLAGVCLNTVERANSGSREQTRLDMSNCDRRSALSTGQLRETSATTKISSARRVTSAHTERTGSADVTGLAMTMAARTVSLQTSSGIGSATSLSSCWDDDIIDSLYRERPQTAVSQRPRSQQRTGSASARLPESTRATKSNSADHSKCGRSASGDEQEVLRAGATTRQSSQPPTSVSSSLTNLRNRSARRSAKVSPSPAPSPAEQAGEADADTEGTVEKHPFRMVSVSEDCD